MSGLPGLPWANPFLLKDYSHPQSISTNVISRTFLGRENTQQDVSNLQINGRRDRLKICDLRMLSNVQLVPLDYLTGEQIKGIYVVCQFSTADCHA